MQCLGMWTRSAPVSSRTLACILCRAALRFRCCYPLVFDAEVTCYRVILEEGQQQPSEELRRPAHHISQSAKFRRFASNLYAARCPCTHTLAGILGWPIHMQRQSACCMLAGRGACTQRASEVLRGAGIWSIVWPSLPELVWPGPSFAYVMCFIIAWHNCMAYTAQTVLDA